MTRKSSRRPHPGSVPQSLQRCGMKPLPRFFALLAVAIMAGLNAVGQEVSPDQSDKTGLIDVIVVDSFGDPLLGAKVSIQGVGEREGIARRLTAGKREPFPYGRYRVTAELDNYSSFKSETELDQPSVTIVVGLTPYALLASQNSVTIRGTFEAHIDPDCRVVRMVPMFTRGPVYDAAVLGDRFMIVDAKAGRYAVVVIGHSGVCRFSQATVGLGSPVVSITIR
jgi:hypothetical protein